MTEHAILANGLTKRYRLVAGGGVESASNRSGLSLAVCSSSVQSSLLFSRTDWLCGDLTDTYPRCDILSSALANFSIPIFAVAETIALPVNLSIVWVIPAALIVIAWPKLPFGTPASPGKSSPQQDTV